MKITGEEKIKNVKARNKNKDGENNPNTAQQLLAGSVVAFFYSLFFRFFFLDFLQQQQTVSKGVWEWVGWGGSGGGGRKTAAYCSL